MHQSLSPRELTERYGITAVTIQRLERGRLLRRWTMKGKRRYSTKDIGRLETVMELTKLGLGAPEIRELLSGSDTPPPDRIAAMVARYTAKRDQLTNRIDRLRSYVGNR